MKKIVLFLCLFLLSCQTTPFTSKPKNLILFIGDGMGLQQISALYYLAKYASTAPVRENTNAFKKLADRGHVAISATEPKGNVVVDSACSATQLAIGEETYPEFIGLDTKGKNALTILEKAKLRGMSTGLVSDTRITHATPASFAAAAANRYMENEIAESLLNVQPDLMYSGGSRYFIPYGKKVTLAPGFVSQSKRKDNLNLLGEAGEKGYTLVHNKEQMLRNKSPKVLGLFAESGMPDAIWQHAHAKDPQRTVPNLKEMTESAVEKLSTGEKGFFLMVEAGQIDWAGHSNDAGGLLHEMVTANETLNFLIDWVEKNPDTLLVVTADHETGGFGFSYHLADVPEPVDFHGDHFKEGKRKVSVNYVPTTVLDRIYAQKTSLKELMFAFDRLPKNQQTAEKLQAMVSENVDFKFSLEAARRVLRVTENIYTDKSKVPEFPLIEGKQAFYLKVEDGRVGLIAQELASQQGVVWATGTHTATPVNVFAYGAGSERFKGYTHHSEVGRWLQETLGFRSDKSPARP